MPGRFHLKVDESSSVLTEVLVMGSGVGPQTNEQAAAAHACYERLSISNKQETETNLGRENGKLRFFHSNQQDSSTFHQPHEWRCKTKNKIIHMY